jgi:hypothetical protein
MLCFVSTAAHAYTMGSFLSQPWGEALRGQVVQRHYGQLLSAQPQTLFDTYIFADLERLSPAQLHQLGEVYQQLTAHGAVVLNDPRRACRRLELLQRLHATGINPFNAYALPARTVPVPRQFPVFIRQANDHNGPLTELLYNQDELEAEVAKLRALGELDAESIVVEFVDTANADGVYLKYGAFRIGTQIIPSRLIIGSHWVLKDTPADYPAAWIEAGLAYAQSETHFSEIQAIFDVANIEFGRLDYGCVEGRLQVFEINTNPTLIALNTVHDEARKWHVGTALAQALRAL